MHIITASSFSLEALTFKTKARFVKAMASEGLSSFNCMKVMCTKQSFDLLQPVTNCSQEKSQKTLSENSYFLHGENFFFLVHGGG